jgi:hypothetical protein
MEARRIASGGGTLPVAKWQTKISLKISEAKNLPVSDVYVLQ